MSLTRSDESRHDFAFIAGAIIGAIAGALVTLALTPMSGADTREKLKSRAGELGPMRDKALEATAPVKEKVTGVAAPVKEKASALAATATEKAQTLAATGKEKAADLAAKTPLGHGHEPDATDMGPEEAGSMLFGSQPGAQPGGTVTPGALADAGADDKDSSHLGATASSATSVTGTTERPPVVQTQDPAEGPRDSTTESGNGRVSETPSSS